MIFSNVSKQSALALVSVGLAAALAAGCGGGGVARPDATVTVNVPPQPTIPDGSVPPPNTPVDPLNPPPAPPPPTPPAPPTEPVDPNAAFDLAAVRALARVGTALYVGDEGGRIWRVDDQGRPLTLLAHLPYGVIEAMTYVAPRDALYLIFDGRRLARFSLATQAFGWLGTVGGEDVVIPDAPPADPGEDGILDEQEAAAAEAAAAVVAAARAEAARTRFRSVTGLAWVAPAPPEDPQVRPDPRDEGVLFACDRARHALFHFTDLDHADTVPDVEALGFLDRDETLGELDVPGYRDLEDLAFDAVDRRLLAVDALTAVLVEVDLADFALLGEAPLAGLDVRAMAWEEAGTRLVVDRDRGVLERVDADGSAVP